MVLMERTLIAAPKEPRWPGAAAVVSVGVLNLFLPGNLSAGPGWLAVGAVAALAIGALLIDRWHVWLGHLAAAVATFELAYSLLALVRDLTAHRGHPTDILRAALLLWSMNVIVFASWYWRLDAGGPHRRSGHEVYCGGAFLFPHLTLSKARCVELGVEDWRPQFIDYLFLAFNASTAFSPTDVPVLSAWAKVLMMTQASIALITLAMVAARAVNIL
jgi:hypothetical protein